MSSECGRALGARHVLAVALCCLLTCSCTAALFAADMPAWLPIGAQPFRFGDDGRADPGGLAFHGPNGEINVTVGVQRVWLQAPADADSLTQPPRERELAVIVSISVDPSGGDRWGSGYGRIELGLVDGEGGVTHKYRACTPSHVAYYSGYCGRFGETLALHVVPLPDELPVQGYVRADAMPGEPPYEPDMSLYSYGSWYPRGAWTEVFPEGYQKE